MLDLNNSLGVEDKPFIERDYDDTVIIKPLNPIKINERISASKKQVESNPNKPILDNEITKDDISAAPNIENSSQREKGEKESSSDKKGEVLEQNQIKKNTSHKWIFILGLIGGVGGFFLAKFLPIYSRS